MTVTETFKKVAGFIVNGFVEGEEGEETGMGPIAQEIDELYPTQDNLAIEPKRIFDRKEDKKVIPYPSANKGYEVVVMEPRSFEDAATVVQDLKDKKTIVLNLHLLDNEQSQRTIDFVCGAAHALNGKPQKVGDKVFVFTPSNVTLSVDMNAVTQNKFNDSLWRAPMSSVQ